MKNIVTKLMVVLVSAFCLITWSGLSEAWAKGPAGKRVQSGVSSRVTTPPVNTGASSSNNVQSQKKSSGDKQRYLGETEKDLYLR
jgi:hypothetical protein